MILSFAAGEAAGAAPDARPLPGGRAISQTVVSPRSRGIRSRLAPCLVLAPCPAPARRLPPGALPRAAPARRSGGIRGSGSALIRRLSYGRLLGGGMAGGWRPWARLSGSLSQRSSSKIGFPTSREVLVQRIPSRITCFEFVRIRRRGRLALAAMTSQ